MREVDVTVVIPAMNREAFIERALQSVSGQTVRPAEVIVVDDASSDRTVDVARRLGATVIELDTNGGSGPARNVGIEAASTAWIAFLDSDDTWLPHHLERLMDATTGNALVSAPGVTPAGRIMGNTTRTRLVTPREALMGDLLCTSGTMVRRDTLREVGGFSSLRRAQDLDMWLRVIERGPGLVLEEVGFTYFLHDQQAIRDTDLMRSCVDEVIERARVRGSIRRHDLDLVNVRRRWDDARTAQRERRHRHVVTHLGWIARRPHTWRALLGTLRQRRAARQGD